MKCPIDNCEEVFNNELDLSSHCLFDHGIMRGMCSSNVDAKRMQIAELMRNDFDRAKHDPQMFLDMYYILWKQHELGIQNVRNLWHFSGNTYIKKGKKVREKVIIPIEEIEQILRRNWFFDTNRAKYYDERYSYKNAKAIDIYE